MSKFQEPVKLPQLVTDLVKISLCEKAKYHPVNFRAQLSAYPVRCFWRTRTKNGTRVENISAIMWQDLLTIKNLS